MATNPQTVSGIGGALPPKPAFADLPPGVTDADYLASNAELKQQISAQYGDILAQLGYYDPASGHFIPGSVEQKADIDTGNLEVQRAQAERGVNQQTQNAGTTFSGIRGTQLADASQPYITQEAGIGFDTTNTLADLYRQGSDLMNAYNTQNMKLLSDAAARKAASAIANPETVAADTAGDSTTATPPPPPSTAAIPEDIDLKNNPPPVQTGVGGIIRPPVAFAKGGEVSRPTRATLGEHARPGDPRSHEVVIPRDKLSTEGNTMLDHLMHMAGIRHAALGRLAGEGHPLNAQVLHSIGDDTAASQLWLSRHPYAASHGLTPNWVIPGLTSALGSGVEPAFVPHPVLASHPVHGVLHPHPIHGDLDDYTHPIHRLAHGIGLAALRRISEGMRPPMAPPPEAVAGHTGAGAVGIPPDDYTDYGLGTPGVPIDVQNGFRAPPPPPDPIPVAPIQAPVGGPQMV